MDQRNSATKWTAGAPQHVRLGNAQDVNGHDVRFFRTSTAGEVTLEVEGVYIRFWTGNPFVISYRIGGGRSVVINSDGKRVSARVLTGLKSFVFTLTLGADATTVLNERPRSELTLELVCKGTPSEDAVPITEVAPNFGSLPSISTPEVGDGIRQVLSGTLTVGGETYGLLSVDDEAEVDEPAGSVLISLGDECAVIRPDLKQWFGYGRLDNGVQYRVIVERDVIRVTWVDSEGAGYEAWCRRGEGRVGGSYRKVQLLPADLHEWDVSLEEDQP